MENITIVEDGNNPSNLYPKDAFVQAKTFEAWL